MFQYLLSVSSDYIIVCQSFSWVMWSSDKIVLVWRNCWKNLTYVFPQLFGIVQASISRIELLKFRQIWTNYFGALWLSISLKRNQQMRMNNKSLKARIELKTLSWYFDSFYALPGSAIWDKPGNLFCLVCCIISILPSWKKEKNILKFQTSFMTKKSNKSSKGANQEIKLEVVQWTWTYSGNIVLCPINSYLMLLTLSL